MDCAKPLYLRRKKGGLAPPLEITAEAEQAKRLIMRDVWRASELSISRAITSTTGHPCLDAELPNGGWPRSSLVELMVQQHYLKSADLVGEQLRYVAEHKGQWVGLLAWSAAAYHLKDREQWIGWTNRQKKRRLPLADATVC